MNPFVKRLKPKVMRGLFLLCLSLSTVIGLPAIAENDEASASLYRWAPAIAIQGGVFAQGASGSITASELFGAQVPPTIVAGLNVPTLPPDYLTLSGQTTTGEGDRMMTPYFGVAVELLSPALSDCDFCSEIGNPRLMVHADVDYSFALDRSLAKTGSVAETMSLPYLPSSIYNGGNQQARVIYEASNFIGQGAQVRVKTDPLVVAAGAGIAFTFKVGGRTFRLKPSFEYMREELDVSGRLRLAVQAANQVLPLNLGDPFTPGNAICPPGEPCLPNLGYIYAPTGDPCFSNGTCDSSSPGNPVNAYDGTIIPQLPDTATPTDIGFREIELDFRDSKVYHGIGPGLELELDTGRLGEFQVSLYGGLRAYRFMGDLDIGGRAQNEAQTNKYTTGDPINGPYGSGSSVEMNNLNYERNCVVGDAAQCEYADFHFEKERWAYTGHLGIRFRWSPE